MKTAKMTARSKFFQVMLAYHGIEKELEKAKTQFLASKNIVTEGIKQIGTGAWQVLDKLLETEEKVRELEARIEKLEKETEPITTSSRK